MSERPGMFGTRHYLRLECHRRMLHPTTVKVAASLLSAGMFPAACGGSGSGSGSADDVASGLVERPTPANGPMSPARGASPAPSPSTTVDASPSPAIADEERDGVVKAGPTVGLRHTDEFDIVVRTERRSGVVRVTVDRVDSLGGEEGRQAAAARGMDYSNDHFEVNDNARTRVYTLGQGLEIWLANPSDVGSPKPLTVSEWRDYVASTRTRERPPMFHFDVKDDRVIGIEEQYFP